MAKTIRTDAAHLFNLDREKRRMSLFFVESRDIFSWVSRFSFIRGWQVCYFGDEPRRELA